MGFYVKAHGVTMNTSFPTMGEAFQAGRALNVSFEVFSQDEGLTESGPVVTYTLPSKDDISESTFLVE